MQHVLALHEPLAPQVRTPAALNFPQVADRDIDSRSQVNRRRDFTRDLAVAQPYDFSTQRRPPESSPTGCGRTPNQSLAARRRPSARITDNGGALPHFVLLLIGFHAFYQDRRVIRTRADERATCTNTSHSGSSARRDCLMPPHLARRQSLGEQGNCWLCLVCALAIASVQKYPKLNVIDLRQYEQPKAMGQTGIRR